MQTACTATRSEEHDVLAFANLEHAVEALQDLVDERLLRRLEGFQRLDDDCFTVEQPVDLAQGVCLEGAARRDEIADKIRLAELGSDLDGAGEVHDLCFDRVSI